MHNCVLLFSCIWSCHASHNISTENKFLSCNLISSTNAVPLGLAKKAAVPCSHRRMFIVWSWLWYRTLARLSVEEKHLREFYEHSQYTLYTIHLHTIILWLLLNEKASTWQQRMLANTVTARFMRSIFTDYCCIYIMYFLLFDTFLTKRAFSWANNYNEQRPLPTAAIWKGLKAHWYPLLMLFAATINVRASQVNNIVGIKVDCSFVKYFQSFCVWLGKKPVTFTLDRHSCEHTSVYFLLVGARSVAVTTARPIRN